MFYTQRTDTGRLTRVLLVCWWSSGTELFSLCVCCVKEQSSIQTRSTRFPLVAHVLKGGVCERQTFTLTRVCVSLKHEYLQAFIWAVLDPRTFGPYWTLIGQERTNRHAPLKRAKRGVRLQSTNQCAAVGGSICSLGWFEQSAALCINARGFPSLFNVLDFYIYCHFKPVCSSAIFGTTSGQLLLSPISIIYILYYSIYSCFK